MNNVSENSECMESLLEYEDSLKKLLVALDILDSSIAEVRELDSRYYEKLDATLSVMDKRISDVLHFLELETLTDAEAIQEVRYLQRLTRERRDLKLLTHAIRAIHTSGLCTGATGVNIGIILKAKDTLVKEREASYKLRDPGYFYKPGNGCHAGRQNDNRLLGAYSSNVGDPMEVEELDATFTVASAGFLSDFFVSEG